MSQQTQIVLIPDAPCIRPDEALLLQLIEVLGAHTFRLVAAYASGEWTVTERKARDRIRSFKVGADEYIQFAARNVDCFVMTEVDGVLEDISRFLRESHGPDIGKWYPCIGIFYVGMHSYPDREHEKATWRGSVSFGIHGDGFGDITGIQKALEMNTQWIELVSRISSMLGVPMRTELVTYY